MILSTLNRKLSIAVLVIAVGLSINLFGDAQERPDVMASFFVNFVFANQIAGDLVNLGVAVGPGEDTHTFEPPITVIERIESADMFIFNGAGYESQWVDPLFANGILDSARQVIVETTKLVNDNGQLIAAPGHGGGHGHHGVNPHVWLDPLLAIEIVRTIEDGLANVDPANAVIYHNNGQRIRGDLGLLDTEIQAGLQSCKHNTLVESFQFIDYFALQYGIETITTSGVVPQEPTVHQIETAIQFVRDNDIKYLFDDKFISPDFTGLTQVAEATGAEILTLETFEGFSGEDITLDDVDYIQVVRDNLAQLRIGLECD
jgi:zinc transport system substrate-binding protein